MNLVSIDPEKDTPAVERIKPADQRVPGIDSGPSGTGKARRQESQAGGSDETGPLQLEACDGGRLEVNAQFGDLLRAHRLETCDAWFQLSSGDVVRKAGPRETRRITLAGPSGSETLYLKRHESAPWRDRIMPWLHGARPILGARNEWNAILKFIAEGIPTMTPVACGQLGSRSLLVTQALPAQCHLLEFVGGRELPEDAPASQTLLRQTRTSLWIDPDHDGANPLNRAPEAPTSLTVRDLLPQVARIARRMHAAGLQHQDFYLNHLLLCDEGPEPVVRVIDLGRVRRHDHLPLRWIVKDLAQLNFSARRLPCRERLRFLRLYLNRPFTPADRRLVERIQRKSDRIAAHTRKHRL
ncbi:MAG: lipopolysaccharide kinase InaA family protein [Planctomycetales bacterium]